MPHPEQDRLGGACFSVKFQDMLDTSFQDILDTLNLKVWFARPRFVGVGLRESPPFAYLSEWVLGERWAWVKGAPLHLGRGLRTLDPRPPFRTMQRQRKGDADQLCRICSRKF